LILLALGAGLGLSSVSPYSYGSSSTRLAAGAIIWLLVTSGAASGIGGYLAGRLRTPWRDADADEVHFRDTANGFLAWAIATLLTAAVLTSAASSMVGSVAKAGAGAAAMGAATTVAATGTVADPADRYFTDMMLRGSKPADAGTDMNAVRREVGGIITVSLASDISASDRAYLAQIVANQTGMAPADADQRVQQVMASAKAAAEATKAKAKDAAEAARKVSQHTALWIFVALLTGAFYAALTATWGGKQRDKLIT
jgi:hypothetical protein